MARASRLGMPKGPYRFSSGVKDSAWVGPLEWLVLSSIANLGRRWFTPSELALNVDRRRLHDCLMRLVRRGVLRRIARGLYEFIAEHSIVECLRVRRLKSNVEVKDAQPLTDGTRGPRVGVVGPFFDNVRGYGGGGYVCGDRGRVLELSDLVFFDRISYLEVLYLVRGMLLPGQLVLYSNVKRDGECVRVEWRPPEGYVKSNGASSTVRMFWESVLVGLKVLLQLVFERGPEHVRSRALRYVRGLMSAQRP